MPYEVTQVSCTPPTPRAGERFTLSVEVRRTDDDGDLNVGIEKQRLVLSSGGFTTTVPTGANYFDISPKPIIVLKGHNSGTSDPIQVKPNPSAGEGDPPVRLPEQLVFTAFGTSGPPGRTPQFLSILVRIGLRTGV
jgi:hypothetical protein